MRKLLRGEIDAVLATRLSQMFVAQRTLLESTEAEQRMKSIEDAVEQLKGAAASNVMVRSSRRKKSTAARGLLHHPVAMQ